MSYYPILVELAGRQALVVGGGEVAERKARTLLEHGAGVSLVARELNPGLKELVAQGAVRFLGEGFEKTLLDDIFIVIAATNDREVNRRVSLAAQERGLLVNAVDQPADCSFIVPSVVRRGDLLVAISTSGKSPALAKRLRKTLEAQLGSAYGPLLDLLGRLRPLVLDLGLPQKENQRLFEAILDAGLLEAIEQEDGEAVREILKRSLPAGLEIENLIRGLDLKPTSET